MSFMLIALVLLPRSHAHDQTLICEENNRS
jgi:hypothetical protein